MSSSQSQPTKQSHNHRASRQDHHHYLTQVSKIHTELHLQCNSFLKRGDIMTPLRYVTARGNENRGAAHQSVEESLLLGQLDKRWMARGQEEGPSAGWPAPGQHVKAGSPPALPSHGALSSVIMGDGFGLGEGALNKLGTKTAKTLNCIFQGCP